MIEQTRRQRNLRRCALFAILSVFAFAHPPRASAQEQQQPAEQPGEEQRGEEAGQQSQSLEQQLQATEKLRKELEAELSRLRDQLDALQARNQRPAATASQRPQQAQQAQQQAPVRAGAQPGAFTGPQGGALRNLQALRQQPPGEQTHIKVFPLQHRDPQEMRQIVMILASPGGGASITDGPGPQSPAGRSPIQPAGGIAAADDAAARPDALRVVADPRSGSIIVRASEDVLKQVESLVAAFDVPPGTVPTLEDRQQGVFTVRFVDPEHVVSLLRDLGVDVTRAPNTNTLSVRASDTTLKEVEDLIEALDVESEP